MKHEEDEKTEPESWPQRGPWYHGYLTMVRDVDWLIVGYRSACLESNLGSSFFTVEIDRGYWVACMVMTTNIMGLPYTFDIVCLPNMRVKTLFGAVMVLIATFAICIKSASVGVRVFSLNWLTRISIPRKDWPGDDCHDNVRQHVCLYYSSRLELSSLPACSFLIKLIWNASRLHYESQCQYCYHCFIFCFKIKTTLSLSSGMP